MTPGITTVFLDERGRALFVGAFGLEWLPEVPLRCRNSRSKALCGDTCKRAALVWRNTFRTAVLTHVERGGLRVIL
jgi:hypothetical protein